MATADLTGGVKIDPMPPSNGASVAISYNGKLANSTNNLILNIGYGDPNNLFNLQKISMQKCGSEFQANFTVQASDRINMYFEDASGNKDDNNGNYYQAPIDSENLSYG